MYSLFSLYSLSLFSQSLCISALLGWLWPYRDSLPLTQCMCSSGTVQVIMKH